MRSAFASTELSPDFTFKSILMGDQNVGKTNLLLRYTKDQFIENQGGTIGAEISTKKMTLRNG